MAHPRQLVQRISEAFAVPEATVQVHDRNLRSAGLRSKGGFGMHAAQMTARDAALLSLALLASDLVKDSVRSVERYMRALPDRARSSPTLFEAAGIADLLALGPEHSFVDGLAGIFQAVATGSFDAMMAGSKPPGTAPWIDVTAASPQSVGTIRIAGLPSGETVFAFYAPPHLHASPSATGVGGHAPGTAGTVSGLSGRGMETVRRIATPESFAIASLLSTGKERQP